MEEKILCVLAGYDADTQDRLAAIQNTLYQSGFVGTHTKDLIQHITLGTFKPGQEQHLMDIMTQAAGKYRPFTVTFHHIGIFGGSKVLFVAPDINRELLALKEDFGDSYNWTPHTTMLIDEPENIYKALPVAAGHFTEFQGKVESIHLFEFWPTRHILSLNLGGRIV